MKKLIKQIIKELLLESLDIKSEKELDDIVTKSINKDNIFYREFKYYDDTMVFVLTKKPNTAEVKFGELNPETQQVMTSTLKGNGASNIILPIVFGLIKSILPNVKNMPIKFEAMGMRPGLYKLYLQKHFPDYTLEDIGYNWYQLTPNTNNK